MTDRKVSRESLKAMAGMSGLDLSDDTLEELLPQIQQAIESIGSLDVLNLDEIEPAIVFKTERE